MPSEAVDRAQMAKVEEAGRLLVEKPQRRDAAATLANVASLNGRMNAYLHRFYALDTLRDALLLTLLSERGSVAALQS